LGVFPEFLNSFSSSLVVIFGDDLRDEGDLSRLLMSGIFCE